MIPAGDYQNGSTINFSGVTSTMPAFNSASNYSGVVIWNCGSQTISGASAVLLPTANYAMDSIRVVNTGSGTLRMYTEPSGYTLGHVEVQGGTLEMSAPVVGNGTAAISSELKINGGTVIGNATYTGDVVAAFGTTLTIGKLTLSSGTLTLTDRPVVLGSAGGFRLFITGDVLQTGGAINAINLFPLFNNTISMSGATAQNLTMTTFFGPISFVIDNASATGVTLLGNFAIPAVPAELILTNGTLNTTATNLLIMAAGAQVSAVSNASFVDGPVKKIGNTDFTFPVGKTNCGVSANIKGYVPIAISNFVGGAVNDEFTAEYKRGALIGAGISATGLNHVSVCDYWTLTKTGASTVDITLSWDNTINNCHPSKPYVDDYTNLVVAHNDNIGGAWDAYSVAGPHTGGNPAGTVTWSIPQSTTFGAFTIGSISFNNPLPINLNYINGTKQGSSNLINWKVTCSNNNPSATMSLERSTDGRNFTTTITSITADALRCQQPFDYTDINPVAGMNYYRLKMTDANGKTSYSVMIGILNSVKGFDIVNLVPNLVTSNAILNVSSAQKTKMDIVIRDMAGKQLQQIQYNLVAGTNQFTMYLGNLNAGVYSITGYTVDGSSKTIRFVKN